MDTIQAVESKLTDITVTAVRPMSLVTNNNKARSGNPPIHSPVTIRPSQSQLPSINISALPLPMLSTTPPATSSSSNSANNLSKYAQLLLVIEELGKDIRPTYSGSRSSGMSKCIQFKGFFNLCTFF